MWYHCNENVVIYIKPLQLETGCPIYCICYVLCLWHPHCTHYDVIKWKHFPRLLALCEGNSSVTGESPHKVPRSFYAFSDWRLNKRDLRRHRAHCEVTVMEHHIWSSTLFNRLQLMFMDGCLNIQSHFNTCGASAFRISMSIFSICESYVARLCLCCVANIAESITSQYFLVRDNST